MSTWLVELRENVEYGEISEIGILQNFIGWALIFAQERSNKNQE